MDNKLPLATLTEDGLLRCSACGKDTVPDLLETGYTVTHDLERVNMADRAIVAAGWNGQSRDVSEEGDAYILGCTERYCWKWHALPDDFTIDWQ